MRVGSVGDADNNRGISGGTRDTDSLIPGLRCEMIFRVIVSLLFVVKIVTRYIVWIVYSCFTLNSIAQMFYPV